MSGSDPAVGEAPTADPFSAFLETFRQARPATRGGPRFNAGEHSWLAARGAELACREVRETHGIDVDEAIFTGIRRRHGDEQLDYGELVALSGDFYESPEALFDERPAPLPWLTHDNDLGRLRELFAVEVAWIEARHDERKGPYPEANIRFAWSAKSYLELALRNVDHFGWHNIDLYRRRHADALRLAWDARGDDGETFRRALHVNAFADHFLTDGFAAGHIRVPRAEIIEWAESVRLGSTVAGALSKLLHDQDGHVDLGSLHGVVNEAARADHDGLLVHDSTGASWRTRCDGQLFLDAGAADSPAVTRAVAAVAASVTELLLAWRLGELPAGTYHATEFVPFPHPDAPRLIDKFPRALPDAELDRLWGSVAWYAKVPWLAGLEKDHIQALFASLPALMAKARARVAAAVEGNPEISRRLPRAYVEAFRNIT